MELLLVLAILVAVASAVTPTVVTRMSEYRLKQGAEVARSAMAATRIHAIDLSSVYQFRYEPGGRRYLAVPTDSDAVAAAQTSKQSSPPGGLPRSYVEYGMLPEDIKFQAAPLPASTGSIGARSDAQTPAWSETPGRRRSPGFPTRPTTTRRPGRPPSSFAPTGRQLTPRSTWSTDTARGFRSRCGSLTGEVSRDCW